MPRSIRGAIHHIDLNVSDLEASRRVYALVLEFLGYELVKDSGGYEWDLKEPGDGRGASIGLRACDPAEAAHVHRRYAPGLHHLAWRAESREDVDRLHALLVANGVAVLDPPAHYPQYSGDYYAVFFEDPDGMKLELVHAPGWI
ncbi:VOC family protein [Sphingomonas sp. AOB5]|uniref:VOC family protein n=1 Tax=Sphingomonas sp. AOB5 TaxID=3034017 RepID=UPI0023F99490|nr:VOC family protein [Sphingomonas sp. AOB5]MDF7774162.1 VOC family protein [Sphingomonas sp. AOB5]